MTEFRKYPSIPRYRKDIQVTEKIDGTNAAVLITDTAEYTYEEYKQVPEEEISSSGPSYRVQAQSRSRIITPGKKTDNHGFAAWTYANAEALAALLGPGCHYGEWWGSGINRGYGLKNGEKHFTLFNRDRYADLEPTPLLSRVPLLYEGPASYRAGGHLVDAVEFTMANLKLTGSKTPFASGYDNPEGVVVFHTASRNLYKVTYEYDEGKWTRKDT